MQRQIESLKALPTVVVGNPGRLAELGALKKLKLAGVTTVVLDEADRLFAPELRDETGALLKLLGKSVQVIANSATLGAQTAALISAYTAAPPTTVLLPGDDVVRHRIVHQALFAEARDKFDILRQYVAAVKPPKALVFTARTKTAEEIASKLRAKQVNALALHALMQKQARKQAMDRFRSGALSVLVTSDLAARGLDIPKVTHVIHLDLPGDTDAFIHRVGRTARNGASGTSVVIGDAYEMGRYAALEKKLGIIVYPKELWGGHLVAPVGDGQNPSSSE